MNTHKSSFLNALILILFGCWAYFTSESPSMTSLIPVFFGVIIMICICIKKNNELSNHKRVYRNYQIVFFVLLSLGIIFESLKIAAEGSPEDFIDRSYGLIILCVSLIIVYRLGKKSSISKNEIKELQRKTNKIISHLVVVLTLIILVALFMPLKAAIGRADNIAIVRVSVMLLSTIFAFYYQIQSFVNARRKSK